MSIQAQTHLLDDIKKAINYSIDEYEISYAEVVGILMLAIQGVSQAACMQNNETEDETETPDAP